MRKMRQLTLTDIQRDALRETASIGISHAATALSKMINKKVLIDVPQVNILPLVKLGDVLSPDDDLVIGVYFKVLGKASGKVLLSFKKDSALRLVDILLKKTPGSTKIMGDIEQSALKELAAISTAVCLNALADFLGMTLIPSVPHLTYDRAKAVVKLVFDEVKNDTEFVVVVDSEFKESNNIVLGRFLIFPDNHAFDAMWAALQLRQGKKGKG